MIYELLHKGESCAVSVKDLCAMTGLSDRAIRRQIERERSAGALIAYSSEPGDSGYYIAETVEELSRFIHAQRKRASTASRTCRPFLAELKRRIDEETARQIPILPET